MWKKKGYTNVDFLERIEARRLRPIYHPDETELKESIRNMELAFYRGGRDRKKKIVAEFGSRSLKEFGAQGKEE